MTWRERVEAWAIALLICAFFVWCVWTVDRARREFNAWERSPAAYPVREMLLK